MHPRFKDGSSVAWLANDTIRYGVVVRGTAVSVDIVPVYRLDSGIKCYDEGGANSVRDKNNVRLRDCPPPFSELCAQVDKNACYALAAAGACCTMYIEEMSENGLDFMRDGTRVSDRDFADILDHFWRDEKEHGVMFADQTPQTRTELNRSPKMSELFRKAASMYGPDQKAGLDGPEL